jgi:3-methyl-2-oxobutanoate hydroxymethyltransferase
MATRKTVKTLQQLRDQGQPITMVTAYDVTFARLFDQAGIDCLLVGDSLGNVVMGYDTTIPVTLDQTIALTSAVVRGASQAHVIADMPFGSYGASVESGVQSAIRLLKEAGAHAVKLEGGRAFAPTVRAMSDMGIPVMGHLGLTPQSVHKLGGYSVQGRGDAAEALLDDALALQEAGAYAIVLEMVPAELAARVTEALRIPTIGIGAGNQTSGQVLVCYDLLGLNEGFSPKFLKRYAQLAETVRDATRAYISEVRERSFPGPEHSFKA